jgi:pimeloyl-ACP methyl ester carboxylesterase
MATGSGGRGLGLVRLLAVLLLLVGAAGAAATAFVHSAIEPTTDHASEDPSEYLLSADTISLIATDGVRLSGWYVRGRSGIPPIILCHDLGGSRNGLLNSAVVLNKAGYPLFLLDFRRHGESAAARSTLGVDERLDVLAVVAFLKTRKGVDARRIGGWGVGMGAYALALAALEEPSITSLALDALYPDVPAEADRLVRDRIPPALGLVVPALHPLYDAVLLRHLSAFSIRSRLAGLAGRNLLLIAASEEPARFAQMQRLYEALPEGPEGGKNLLELRRSGLTGLYAEDRSKYDDAIRGFFAGSLLPGRAAAGGTGIEVIEK